MIRWLAAILGYTFFRLPGAILGFLLGSLLDNTIGSRGGFRASFGGGANGVTPADFELNLLSLASLVIKADGSQEKQVWKNDKRVP